MNQKNMLFWIWLSERLGAANRDFRRLILLYETPYDVFHAEEAELARVENLSPKTVAALSDKDLRRAGEILEACERMRITVLPYDAELYPPALRDLKAPPVLLYCKGKMPNLSNRLSIGMVGTRRMSEYGMRTAYQIAYELACTNTVVVSGMAAGIDGICAAGALAAGGETVAVLGCGVDVVYPRHHQTLMQEIERKGAVISEYPPGTPPNHYHFPTRNRLISGLTRGTVVVEAGIGSGSLITAREAILQGRDVYALPANVGSKGAEGTNGLLRDGANLVLSTKDIVDAYAFAYPDTLFVERIQLAEKRSRPDFEYLVRLGVIELAEKAQRQLQKEAVQEDREPPVQPSLTTKAAKTKTVRKQKTETGKRSETVQTGEQEAMPALKETATPSKTPDEALSALSPIQLAIFRAIPDDRAISVEALGNLDYPYGDLIAALTMLEILGVIQKLPGALYTKC